MAQSHLDKHEGELNEAEDLETEIKKLDLQDRAMLAKWLLDSLDDPSDLEIEALWVEEAEHRLDELDRGLVEEIPAEDVLRRARTAIS